MVGAQTSLFSAYYHYSSVLPEASHSSASTEYLTLKEKVHKVSINQFQIESEISDE